ncbi:MAG TPA: c-type cytochrome [Arsenicitalea sp.]|jgi:mono/diheme cytochrome c family protein|nr:c-type cytochrome [Arsenicitalea sp.]
MRAAFAFTAAISASALLLGAGDAQTGQAPAIGQAPAASPTQAAQAPAAQGKPVSYSNEQADRGEKRYNTTCADCHGDDLKGGLIGGPPLRGVAFDQAFANGAPASALFGFMSTQMPPDSPGQFSASVYADVMAYVLKQNGYAAGAPLPSDSDALDHLIIQK